MRSVQLFIVLLLSPSDWWICISYDSHSHQSPNPQAPTKAVCHTLAGLTHALNTAVYTVNIVDRTHAHLWIVNIDPLIDNTEHCSRMFTMSGVAPERGVPTTPLFSLCCGLQCCGWAVQPPLEGIQCPSTPPTTHSYFILTRTFWNTLPLSLLSGWLVLFIFALCVPESSIHSGRTVLEYFVSLMYWMAAVYFHLKV